MSLLEDAFKGGNLLTGAAVVVGAVVLAPIVLPLARSAAKTVVKAGLVTYDQGRDLVEDARGRTGELVAEARAERAERGSKREPARGEATPAT